MLKAILFDLDDTLLGNNTRLFLAHYFRLLADYAIDRFEPDKLLAELLYCTQQVIADSDPSTTNREVFWNHFEQHTGSDSGELEPFFEQFYRNSFPSLRSHTQQRPEALDLVRFAQGRGWQVVVATNPLFPTVAIEERLLWAGLPVAEMEFDLVTTMDNMHFTKPHQAYYEEILGRIGLLPADVLVVGDDWENDIVPAFALGCATFWVTNGDYLPSDPALVSGFGDLRQLLGCLEAGWLQP